MEYIQGTNPQEYGKKSLKQDDPGTPYPPIDEWKNKKTDQTETASTQESKSIKREIDRYRQLQHDVQFQIRSAHKDFMKTAVSDTFKNNPKKNWSFMKNTGQEATGVSPLENKDGFLKSENTSKANILNDQFVSVFTKEDTSSFADKGPSPYPSKPNIEVS